MIPKTKKSTNHVKIYANYPPLSLEFLNYKRAAVLSLQGQILYSAGNMSKGGYKVFDQGEFIL